jgi:hypothetical protein
MSPDHLEREARIQPYKKKGSAVIYPDDSRPARHEKSQSCVFRLVKPRILEN